MSSSTSSQTIPATVLPRLVATTLVVLHDQVHAPRPTAAQMATLVDTTLRRAHQLADVTPPPPLATDDGGQRAQGGAAEPRSGRAGFCPPLTTPSAQAGAAAAEKGQSR